MRKPLNTRILTSDGSHKHQFKLVFYESSDPDPVFHPHEYQGITSYNVGHDHRLFGVTAPAPDTPDHVHEYEGTTTFDDGHVHYYRGVTSPPIPLPDGGHYHIIEGVTTVNGRTPHSHEYEGIAE